MNILGTILKTIDIDLDLGDVLDVIHRQSPGLAYLIACVIGFGGMAVIVMFFIEYMQ